MVAQDFVSEQNCCTETPRREHSRKPDEVYPRARGPLSRDVRTVLTARLGPLGPRCRFARNPVPGAGVPRAIRTRSARRLGAGRTASGSLKPSDADCAVSVTGGRRYLLGWRRDRLGAALGIVVLRYSPSMHRHRQDWFGIFPDPRHEIRTCSSHRRTRSSG